MNISEMTHTDVPGQMSQSWYAHKANYQNFHIYYTQAAAARLLHVISNVEKHKFCFVKSQKIRAVKLVADAGSQCTVKATNENEYKTTQSEL